MSVICQQVMQQTTRETIATALDAPGADSSEVITHDLHANGEVDNRKTLHAGSTPPATKVWSDKITLSSGTATIDLTALTGAFAAAVTFAGLKIQAAHFAADSNNTERLKIAQGGSEPYYIFGWDGDSVTLFPGEETLARRKNTLQIVGALWRKITITSADADAIIDIHLVAG